MGPVSERDFLHRVQIDIKIQLAYETQALSCPNRGKGGGIDFGFDGLFNVVLETEILCAREASGQLVQKNPLCYCSFWFSRGLC